MGADKEVLIRTAVLVAALINQILVLSGKKYSAIFRRRDHPGTDCSVYSLRHRCGRGGKTILLRKRREKGDEAAKRSQKSRETGRGRIVKTADFSILSKG